MTSADSATLPGTRIPPEAAVPDGHSFALCLTHDVDRPYKTYQGPYYAIAERDPSHLRSLIPGVNPYWSFERIAALEADLGVRSAFYFMDEQQLFRDRPVSEWLDPDGWLRYVGRYAIDDPAIVRTMRELDAGGWEIGLHGSFESFDDPDRLRSEKRRLESLLGHRVRGGRQHHLNLAIPETWEHHSTLGLEYDSTLGSSSTYGFENGYHPFRPFDDAFVEFPLTLMDVALPEVAADPVRARAECESLLEEAAEHEAVMTVLWHPRYLGDDFPEHVELYRTLVRRALELGAWVGPPGALYDSLGDEPGEPSP
ncbi:polysaccharide deacetylase family protein [Halorubrum sp. AD140]|uniref:polysaccharide deacetylase family protein n=1 Tax=Halorubrum sp. AD140 TaxID=3050073 RepID=UPI002ACC48FB|nr:polysaccharide deacetylase family protein [Halorubrum sp. AD140]MDZ5810230.1 polysaccharide deacetylase family protein [Halorubrum sp. AD140]